MFDLHLAGTGGKKIVAVADIGSGSAGLAVIVIEKGAPARVLAAERTLLPLEERSREATVAALGDSLVQAGEKALKEYSRQSKKPQPVSELFCIIRPPWSRSRSASAHTVLQEDTVVTGTMIGELAKQALMGEKEIDKTRLLEASVVRIELNGYATAEPEGKKANEITLFALVSDCDADIRAMVQKSLERLLPQVKASFRSSTRALLSTLREREGELKEYVIVDMASEGTNLIAVRGGLAAEQILVPEGMRTILKRLSPGGMPEETLNLMRMLERDQSSNPASEDLRVSLGKVEPELVRVFGEGMSVCAALHRLPERLVLVAHPDLAPWLAKFFARIDFTQFTLTTQPFTVETLSSKDLSRFVLPEAHVNLDTGLALGAALVNIEQK